MRATRRGVATTCSRTWSRRRVSQGELGPARWAPAWGGAGGGSGEAILSRQQAFGEPHSQRHRILPAVSRHFAAGATELRSTILDERGGHETMTDPVHFPPAFSRAIEQLPTPRSCPTSRTPASDQASAHTLLRFVHWSISLWVVGPRILSVPSL